MNEIHLFNTLKVLKDTVGQHLLTGLNQTLYFTVPEGVDRISFAATAQGGGGGAGMEGSVSTTSKLRGGTGGSSGAGYYINQMIVEPKKQFMVQFKTGGSGGSVSGAAGSTGGDVLIYYNNQLLITLKGGPAGKGGNRTGTLVPGSAYPASSATPPNLGEVSRGAIPAIVSLSASTFGGTLGAYNTDLGANTGNLSRSLQYTGYGRGGDGGNTSTTTWGRGSDAFRGAVRFIWGEDRLFPSTNVIDID